MENSKTKSYSISEIKEALGVWENIITDPKFQYQIHSKTVEIGDIINKLYIASDIAQTAVSTFDESQKIELNEQNFNNEISAINFDLLQSSETFDNLLLDIQPLAKKLIEQFPDSNNNDELKIWLKAKDLDHQKAMAKVIRLIELEKIISQRLEEYIKLLSKEDKNKEISAISEQLEKIIQSFDDFRQIIKELSKQLVKLVGNSDYINQTYFELSEFILKLDNKLFNHLAKKKVNEEN